MISSSVGVKLKNDRSLCLSISKYLGEKITYCYRFSDVYLYKILWSLVCMDLCQLYTRILKHNIHLCVLKTLCTVSNSIKSLLDSQVQTKAAKSLRGENNDLALLRL